MKIEFNFLNQSFTKLLMSARYLFFKINLKFSPKLQDLFKKLLAKDFKKRLGHKGSE
jgi:hypothetical protein